MEHLRGSCDLRCVKSLQGRLQHRIPLPPLAATYTRLPAAQPTTAWPAVELRWLQQCHPHARDRRIQFEEEGHRYYVEGASMDPSVIGLQGQFSEAWVRVSDLGQGMPKVD